MLDQWLARNQTPGAVVAVQIGDGAPIFVAAGKADRHLHTRMRADDAFRIGSVTKAFVGDLALQLSEQHRLDLDAPIARWYPTVPNADRVTVRDLLTHRSGFASIGDDAGPGPYYAAWIHLIGTHLTHTFTPQEIITFAEQRPLLSPPGTAVHYSNLNTILLAQIITTITHTNIATALRARILNPLGLRDTYYAATERRPPAPVPGVQHVSLAGPLVDENAFPDTGLVTALGAAGSMISTPADLLKWSHAYFRARVRGNHDLTTSVFRIDPSGTGLGVLGVANDGFCLFNAGGCRPHNPFIAVGTEGAVPGGSVEVLYDPTEDFTVVTAANADQVNLDDLTLRTYYLTKVGTTQYDKAFATPTKPSKTTTTH